MDPRLSDWFDSTVIPTPTSIDELTHARVRNKRKRETANRIGDELEQHGEQFSQVLNSYLHFSAPIGAAWFQQGLDFAGYLHIPDAFIIFQ